jgi:hypothetical protein
MTVELNSNQVEERQAPEARSASGRVTPDAADVDVISIDDKVFRVVWAGANSSGTDWNEDLVGTDQDPEEWFESTGYAWPSEERRKFRKVWPQLADAEVDRPRAFDIAKSAELFQQRPMLIEDLLGERGILFIAAEEGGGKSTAVDQLARELLTDNPVWGMFRPGDAAPGRILMIHTEMDEPEVREQAADSEARGLAVAEEKLFTLCAGGLDLAKSADDRNFIEAEIRRLRPEMIILDSASNAVVRPQEDEDVRAFFNWLSLVHNQLGVRGTVIVGHPRKQGHERHARRFDDLFGSREWKGRVSKALWLEGSTFRVWKDRGGHLSRRFGRRNGRQYAEANLARPGLENQSSVPFVVSPLLSEEEERTKDEDKVLAFVLTHPAEFTKSALAKALGGNKQKTLTVIGDLIKDRRLGPDKHGAKLGVVSESHDD